MILLKFDMYNWCKSEDDFPKMRPLFKKVQILLSIFETFKGR